MIFEHYISWAVDFPSLCKIWRKNVVWTGNYGKNWNPWRRPSAMLYFWKPDFWATGHLGLPTLLHLGSEFGAKKLIDAEIIQIMAENRNPWWWPSAILEFCKIGILSSMTPLAADFPSLYKICLKNVDLYRRRNYDTKSKSKIAAVRHLWCSKIWFISTGNLCIADFPSLYQIRRKSVDGRWNYDPK